MKYQHLCPHGLDFCCKTTGKQHIFDTGLATTFINAYKTNEISICCPPWCHRIFDFCYKTNGKQYILDTSLATTFINAYKTYEISICCPPWCHPIFLRQMHQNGPMPAGQETDTFDNTF